MAVAGERCGVPYARREGGLGTAFLAGGTRIQTLIATILAVAAAIVFAGPTGIVLLAVAGATALVVGQFATSRLSGVTGYVYGAVNELAAMAMFVVAALLTVCEGVGSEAIRGRGLGMLLLQSRGADSQPIARTGNCTNRQRSP